MISFRNFFLHIDYISARNVSYSEVMNPTGIFANNELDLQKIKVYGFDFGWWSFSNWPWKCHFHLFSNIDYTLARYKPTLHSLIYDHAKKYLVQNLRVTISNWKTSWLIVIFIGFEVSRSIDGFLFSTWHGCSRSSFGYQTWMVDESG